MEKPEPKRAKLGYHNLGDYFYFSLLPDGNYFFGLDNKEFKDHASFAGLVTAVHEHYHLMQELTQGYFWWHQLINDSLAMTASQMVKRNEGSIIEYPLWDELDPRLKKGFIDFNDTNSIAQFLVIELNAVHLYWKSPELTQKLLSNEIRDSPELASFMNEDIFNLTTIDLVECHAAILTEIYISKLLVEHPEKFDNKVVDDMAGLFRVDRMDSVYLRPLRIMIHISTMMGIDINYMVEDAHLLYGQIKHGAIYFLLAYLLDYALHLPPDPLLLLAKTPDTACNQDIYPPLRFINLVFIYFIELITNRGGYVDILTNEKMYYPKGSPALAKLINDMHAKVREKSTKTETFFSIEQTTKLWIEKIKSSPTKDLLPLVHTVLSNCVQYRLDNPSFYFELRPSDFDLVVELPRMIITGKGLSTLPYWIMRDRQPDTELSDKDLEYMQKAVQSHFDSFRIENHKNKSLEQYSPTLAPFRFIEELLVREMLHRFSKAILYEKKLRCPLTESIGRYIPCNSRTIMCELIFSSDIVPKVDCLFSSAINNIFGDIRYIYKGS